MFRLVRNPMMGLAFAIGAIGLSGCEPSAPDGPVLSSMSGQKLESNVAEAPSRTTSGLKEIFLILPAAETAEARMISQFAGAEAGLQKQMLFKILRPEPGTPPSAQADTVREAVRRGASVLIVQAADPKGLAPTLAEVRDQGIPIVLLDRDVPMPSGKRLPLVAPEPLGDSAKQLIEAARRDAAAKMIPTDGPAIILLNKDGDSRARARVDHMKAALKEAGIPLYGVLEFDSLPAKAHDVIQEALKKEPKICLVMADEDQGIVGATEARKTKEGAPGPNSDAYVVVGYVSDRRNLNLTNFGDSSAMVDMALGNLSRKVVQTAVALAEGKTVPDRIEVKTPLRRPIAPIISTGPVVPATPKEAEKPEEKK